MIESPKISVLMPAYNAEKFIVEAIESILDQSFIDFELIITDDCSTDKTWELIQEYARRDERLFGIKNEKNLGIAGNRNALVCLAKGKYIVWQDADDISFPDRLAHQYDFMENNPSVGICGGWLQFFNDKSITSTRKYKEHDAEIRKTIFRYSPVAQPGAMLRKSVLDEMGFYDLSYPPAEDLDMSFRIGRKYQFANLQELVIKYRESETSATFTKLQTIELKTISIRLKYSDGKFYQMTFSDHVFTILQYISALVVPAKLKIAIFNILRNSKV